MPFETYVSTAIEKGEPRAAWRVNGGRCQDWMARSGTERQSGDDACTVNAGGNTANNIVP